MSQIKCAQSLQGREIACEDMKSTLCLRNCCGGSQRMHEGGKGDEAAELTGADDEVG